MLIDADIIYDTRQVVKVKISDISNIKFDPQNILYCRFAIHLSKRSFADLSKSINRNDIKVIQIKYAD